MEGEQSHRWLLRAYSQLTNAHLDGSALLHLLCFLLLVKGKREKGGKKTQEHTDISEDWQSL